jgi:hypothetical protein
MVALLFSATPEEECTDEYQCTDYTHNDTNDSACTKARIALWGWDWRGERSGKRIGSCWSAERRDARV